MDKKCGGGGVPGVERGHGGGLLCRRREGRCGVGMFGSRTLAGLGIVVV